LFVFCQTDLTSRPWCAIIIISDDGNQQLLETKRILQVGENCFHTITYMYMDT
jgi:hypothetical protein